MQQRALDLGKERKRDEWGCRHEDGVIAKGLERLRLIRKIKTNSREKNLDVEG